MATRTKLPKNGSSTDHLRRALRRRDVVLILFAYAHGALSSFDVMTRFHVLKVKVGADELEQLFALALTDAKALGTDRAGT